MMLAGLRCHSFSTCFLVSLREKRTPLSRHAEMQELFETPSWRCQVWHFHECKSTKNMRKRTNMRSHKIITMAQSSLLRRIEAFLLRSSLRQGLGGIVWGSSVAGGSTEGRSCAIRRGGVACGNLARTTGFSPPQRNQRR